MKAAFCALLFFSVAAGVAQPNDPVTWTAAYRSSGDKAGEIIVTGFIQKGWHTYSQRPTDAGPIPTAIGFAPSINYVLNGKTTETGAFEEFVPAFDAKIFVFHDKAEFRQKISLKTEKPFTVPVTVEYMSCNDKMCLPPKTATLQVQVSGS